MTFAPIFSPLGGKIFSAPNYFAVSNAVDKLATEAIENLGFSNRVIPFHSKRTVHDILLDVR